MRKLLLTLVLFAAVGLSTPAAQASSASSLPVRGPRAAEVQKQDVRPPQATNPTATNFLWHVVEHLIQLLQGAAG